MQKHGNFLGLLGLFPFIALPLLVIGNQLSLFEAVGYFTQYSAVILSFLGGIHWYDSFTRTHNPLQLYIAMLPSIVAWLSLVFLNGTPAMVVLAAAFVLMLFYDQKTLDMTPAYFRMRQKLTGVVVGCHAIMVWLLSH
ncbi:MAG: DUF3429 domain-containing protein [Aestuariibacter sp.]